MMTKKEMRLYEVERSTEDLRKALSGKNLTECVSVLAEMALEDTEAEPCNAGQKGDICIYESNGLVDISLPVMAEIEIDEDGEELADIGYDYSDDVFERRQLWDLAIYLFGVADWMMDDIVTIMNDDTREKVHNELAPCDALDFLHRYCELAPDFERELRDEFGISL